MAFLFQFLHLNHFNRWCTPFRSCWRASSLMAAAAAASLPRRGFLLPRPPLAGPPACAAAWLHQLLTRLRLLKAFTFWLSFVFCLRQLKRRWLRWLSAWLSAPLKTSWRSMGLTDADEIAHILILEDGHGHSPAKQVPHGPALTCILFKGELQGCQAEWSLIGSCALPTAHVRGCFGCFLCTSRRLAT